MSSRSNKSSSRKACNEILTIDDLKIVFNELQSCSNKWYFIGLELDLSPDILDNIKGSSKENDEYLLEVLKRYLRWNDPCPTWRRIIIALKSKSVRYGQLAEEIERKYLSIEGPVRTIGGNMKITSCSRSQSLPSTFQSHSKKSYDLRRHNTQAFSNYSHGLSSSENDDPEMELSDSYEPDSSTESSGTSSESDTMDVIPAHKNGATTKGRKNLEEDINESECSEEGREKMEAHMDCFEIPPKWIQQTTPVLSPFLPQVGDHVVYCYQGHSLYINCVKKEKIHDKVSDESCPWKWHSLRPQEKCEVTNIVFCVGPPTLCEITLTVLDSQLSSTSKGKTTFTFQYHDVDGVPDFIILNSLYEESLGHNWTPGKKFHSLIDNKYWLGRIKEKKPIHETIPDSYWQCYLVRWEESGKIEQLSPWEMEPLPDRNSHISESHAVRLLADSSSNASMKEVWGGEGEQKRILMGLPTIMDLDEAHMFKKPVDLHLLPDYCKVVAFPTDLSTIEKKLSNGFYRRKSALLWEVETLWRNACEFNEPGSLIVKHAGILLQTLIEFINSTTKNPMKCYHNVVASERDTSDNSEVNDNEHESSDSEAGTDPSSVSAENDSSDPEKEEFEDHFEVDGGDTSQETRSLCRQLGRNYRVP